MGPGDPLFAAEAIYARGTEVKLAFYSTIMPSRLVPPKLAHCPHCRLGEGSQSAFSDGMCTPYSVELPPFAPRHSLRAYQIYSVRPHT